MKFGRLLRTTSKDQPEIEALFAAYKSLKKHVKRLPYKEQLGQQGTMEALSEEESRFVKALSDNLAHLNEMFIEKEENSVIRVEHLEHRLAGPLSPEALGELHQQFVDFHGEVLLMMHWSILAYTATVKILKKHTKRTGLLVRAPQLGNLLSQPFCSTELMTSIAHRVEDDIQRLAERMGVSGQRTSEPTEQQQAAAAAAGGAAAAAAVAAAVAAGEVLAPRLSNGGLDLELLQQLADSASVTSQSDAEGTGAEDTGRSKLNQQQQECSRQAHLLDRGSFSEVDSRPKQRRRLEQVDTSGCRPAAGLDAAAAAAAPGPAAGPAVVEAAAGDSTQQQQQHQEQQPAGDAQQPPAVLPLGQQQACKPEAACAAAAAPPQKQLQHQQHQQAAQVLLPLVPQRRSVTGATGAESQLQAPVPALAAEPAAGGGGCVPAAPVPVFAAAAPVSSSSSPAAKGSIMRQTQVALTTWRHLQCTASTPSTVVPRIPDANAVLAGTVLTESSAA